MARETDGPEPHPMEISRREAKQLATLRARGRLAGGGALMVIGLARLALADGVQDVLLWLTVTAVALGLVAFDAVLKALGRGGD